MNLEMKSVKSTALGCLRRATVPSNPSAELLEPLFVLKCNL